MEIANKHDWNDTNININTISLLVTSLQVEFGCRFIRMLDRSSKTINGGGRALVLHAQRMKMVLYVQLVVRKLSDSWHRYAFDS